MKITALHCPELQIRVGLLAWSDLDEATIRMAWQCLPADDAAVIRRRRHEQDRQRSLGARIALASMWAGLGGQTAASRVDSTHQGAASRRVSDGSPDCSPDWAVLSMLRKDRLGRPWLDGCCAASLPAISFSHAGAWSVCAMSLAGGRIGVDIEQQPEDMTGLDSLFSTQERERLSALVATGMAGNRAMLRGWTIKEATLKAVGCGFLSDPQAWQISTGWPMAEDAGTICGPQGTVRWRHIESPAAYVLTVARLD